MLLTGRYSILKVPPKDVALLPKLFVGALLSACAATFIAGPAAAQIRQNDARAGNTLDLFYKLDADWTLAVSSKVLFDRNFSRWNDVQFRPNVIYSFSPEWSAGVGYVQFQPVQSTSRTQRGAFQDVFYRTNFGRLSVSNRLRVNETFADQSSALRIFSSYALSLRHPIGESDWFALLADEPVFNLKVDGTGRQAGFLLNRTTLGIGRPIVPGMVATLKYELSETNVQGSNYLQHTFLLGLDIRFN